MLAFAGNHPILTVLLAIILSALVVRLVQGAPAPVVASRFPAR